MNKAELVNSISEKSELNKKDSEKALSAFIETITEELVAGNKVALVGFGSFEVADRPAREGRNPLTKETIHIEAKRAPKFKAAKGLKDALNV